MTERWTAYDKDRKVIDGVILNRADFPKGNLYHLAVNVWVRHRDGDWLFMQRAATKSHFPLYYEAGAGGSVLLGESSQVAAHRELREETGLVAEGMEFLFSFTESQHHTHFDTYLAVVTGDKDAIAYQLSETQNHVWVQEEDVLRFLEESLVFDNQKQQLQAYLNKNL